MTETNKTTTISYIYNKEHDKTTAYELADSFARTEIEKLKEEQENISSKCNKVVEDAQNLIDQAKNEILEEVNNAEIEINPISIKSITRVGNTDQYTVTLSNDEELSEKITIPAGKNAILPTFHINESGDLYAGNQNLGHVKGESLKFEDLDQNQKEELKGTLPANIVTAMPDSAKAKDEVLYVGKSQNGFEFGQTYIYTTYNITTTLASPVKVFSYILLDNFFSKLKNQGYNDNSITITYTSDCNNLSDFFSGQTYGENDKGYYFTLNENIYIVLTSDIGIQGSNTEDPHSYTITKKTSNFWIPKFKLN